MKRLVAIPLCILMFATLVGVAGSCKQGEGDRCQVDEDCSGGLQCNQATKVCAKSAGGGIDATVPDGPDAAPDAPTDAATDAKRD